MGAAVPAVVGSTGAPEMLPPAVVRAPGTASVYSIDVVTDEPTFVAVEDGWNDAVDRAAVPHPFLRHEWIRAWWDCFGANARLHIIMVREGGRIVAIAPLMSEMARMYGVPVRRLRLMQNDHTPRIDFIVTDGPEAAYCAIWRALRQTRWDVLQLGQLPHGSQTQAMLESLASADGCRTGVWRSGDAPYLTLNGTWEQYFKSRPAKFRQNLRNRLSRLMKIGEPALETLDAPDDILAACGDVFRLEASGWKSESGTAVAADPAVHRFYSLLAERASERGWLRLLFLTVNGRRIASAYAARYANRLFFVKTGYDPEYAQYGPFKLLTYLAVQQSFAEGLEEVDFLGDTEPWKLEWTADARPHDWLFVFSTSGRARFSHCAKFQIVPALKRWRGR